MISGVNDDLELAPKLADLAAEAGGAFVNLIPFNPIPYQGWRPSTDEQIRRFAGILEARGVPVAVRETRGCDIDAACGQLRGHVAQRAAPGPETPPSRRQVGPAAPPVTATAGRTPASVDGPPDPVPAHLAESRERSE